MSSHFLMKIFPDVVAAPPPPPNSALTQSRCSAAASADGTAVYVRSNFPAKTKRAGKYIISTLHDCSQWEQLKSGTNQDWAGGAILACVRAWFPVSRKECFLLLMIDGLSAILNVVLMRVLSIFRYVTSTQTLTFQTDHLFREQHEDALAEMTVGLIRWCRLQLSAISNTQVPTIREKTLCNLHKNLWWF